MYGGFWVGRCLYCFEFGTCTTFYFVDLILKGRLCIYSMEIVFQDHVLSQVFGDSLKNHQKHPKTLVLNLYARPEFQVDGFKVAQHAN